MIINSLLPIPIAPVRASSYTIYVDLPNDKERMLLVHGFSGAYDNVSRNVANYVRSKDPKPAKPLYGTWDASTSTLEDVQLPAPETIEMLTKRGYLTSLSIEDEYSRFERVATNLHNRHQFRMPSYVVMPTYDCNLRCNYCFQDHMRTDSSYNHLLRVMSHDTVDRMVSAFPEIERRQGVQQDPGTPRNILFFGGEPLLARSRETIEYIITKVRQNSAARFAAITNATELDAYVDLLGPDGIAELQITIDGPPDQHDKRRIYADGSGSFANIARNVDLALQLGVSVDLRMNIDRSNISDLPVLAEIYKQRGWTNNRNFSAYAAPVHSPNDRSVPKQTFNSHELKGAIIKMRSEHAEMRYIGLADDGLKAAIGRLLGGNGADPLSFMKATFCGAHTNMYIFDAFSDIYACWERTGDARIRIGWIDEKSTPHFIADRSSEWRSRNVTTNDTCGRCRYSLYCGGGCAVLAEDVHGTMYGNYCDAFGRRFRETVAEAFVECKAGVAAISDSAAERRAM